MIFIDTNIFLRFLLRDNEDQYQQAKQIFTQAARLEVELITSTVVFFEVVWVLAKSFKKDKPLLIQILLEITALNIGFEQKFLIINSIVMFQNSSLGLVDCFNLLYAKDKQALDFKTFDKKLISKFEKLSKD
jgi:predicted nucleic-acid-binding protein